jgi:hypothetical protein
MSRSALDPGPLPTVASWTLGLAGVVHVLLGIQFFALWWLETWQMVVVGAMVAGGAAAVAAAFPLGQGRSRPAVLGAVLAPLLGLLSTAWGAYALWNLSFALYMLFAPPAALLATLTVPLAIGPARRSERAVAELRAKVGNTFGL